MANRVDIATRRDPFLEWERLMRENKLLLETALQTSLKIHPKRFVPVGPDLRCTETGQTMEEVTGDWRKTNPHDFADFIPADPDQILHTYIEEAFGERCCPKTVGNLARFLNDETRFHALAKAWGCDPVRMIPGKRPGTADSANDGDGNPKHKTGPTDQSPFNPARHFGSDAARQSEIARYIKAFGTRSAARAAQKFSVDLAGRPLRSRA